MAQKMKTGGLRHTSNQTQKLSERIWAPQRNHATSIKKNGPEGKQEATLGFLHQDKDYKLFFRSRYKLLFRMLGEVWPG